MICITTAIFSSPLLYVNRINLYFGFQNKGMHFFNLLITTIEKTQDPKFQQQKKAKYPNRNCRWNVWFHIWMINFSKLNKPILVNSIVIYFHCDTIQILVYPALKKIIKGKEYQKESTRYSILFFIKVDLALNIV